MTSNINNIAQVAAAAALDGDVYKRQREEGDESTELSR